MLYNATKSYLIIHLSGVTAERLLRTSQPDFSSNHSKGFVIVHRLFRSVMKCCTNSIAHFWS